MSQLPNLIDRLFAAAHAWASAHDVRLSRLGKLVLNDTAFFARLTAPGASMTTATLEKFASWLNQPANWPDGEVPGEALELARVAGVPPADGPNR